MAHKAILEIDGVKFEVLNCSYSFHQHVNPHTNETTSEIFGGNIDFTVATRKGDQMGDNAKIIDLMLLPHKDDVSGNAEFFNQKGESVRKIEFSHGAVVNFSESFSLGGEHAGIQNFTITCRDMKVGDYKLVLNRE